jgi:hypothetical protein
MPLLENASERGIFMVQLRWPEVPLNPQGAFQVEAVFLNASAHDPSPESIPQSRTNPVLSSKTTSEDDQSFFQQIEFLHGGIELEQEHKKLLLRIRRWHRLVRLAPLQK